MSSEQEIFDQLSELCGKKGFIHTLVKLNFKYNYYKVNKNGNITSSQIAKAHADRQKLIRSELVTLLALTVKNNPEFFCDSEPKLKLSKSYEDKVYELLENFHNIFRENMIFEMQNRFSEIIELKNTKLFSESDVFLTTNSVREAIFYSGDAVYDSQYQDLGYFKYRADNDWFVHNKGFSIEHAHEIIEILFQFHHFKIHQVAENKQISLNEFIYSEDEIIEFLKLCKSELTINEIMLFISAFSFNLDNLIDLNAFQKFDDFNSFIASPFIALPNNKFLLLDFFHLSQAFYETPFFWLSNDNEYKSIASKHRGDFAENFTYEIVSEIFGKENTWKNIDLYGINNQNQAKKDKIGEIDILVNVSGYVLLFQAKAKKLTLESRKGNIPKISDDFAKSIQHAYNQAFECGEILLSNEYIAKVDEQIIQLPKIDFCFPICILSEHFPALTAQVRWLLKENIHKNISNALVIDVFLLDLMQKTLSKPLDFMHFIKSFSNARKIFLANNQIELLAVHLKRNFLCSDGADIFYLEDGFSADLDLYLSQTRRGINQKNLPEVPSGWLKFKETYWWELFEFTSLLDSKNKLKFGFELMQWSEEFIKNYNHIVSERIQTLNLNPNKEISNFSIISSNNTGLTAYVINTPFITDEIESQIQHHAILKKYQTKLDLWVSLIINTKGKVKHLNVLDEKWKFDSELQKEYEETLAKNSRPMMIIDGQKIRKKIGRNEPCPCLSGKKYKRCCLK